MTLVSFFDEGARMQVSDYNFLTARDDGGIIYNAAKGTFTAVDVQTFEALARKQIPALDPPFLDQLTKAGIVHDGTQKDMIRARFDLARFSGTNVVFTMAPTIECNLACWYCYQNERRHLGTMDRATEEASLAFIWAAAAGKKSFSVDWFGGEPLLAAPLIERVTQRLVAMSEETGPRYAGGMIITNGLLFDAGIVAMLRRGGIDRAQVSIDRLRHVPPKCRGLLDRAGEPSAILQNVLKFRNSLNFSIRINMSAISDEERASIEQVLDRHDLRAISYVSRVENNLAECSSLGGKIGVENGLTRKAYAAVKRTFASPDQDGLDAVQSQLTPRRGYCGATNGGLFVIDHRGDVSRCFFSAGVADERIGNVHDMALTGEDETPNPVEARWRGYTPFDYASCSECRVLPLCMGGCSHARVLHDAIKPPCESIKYNITTYVREIATRLMPPNPL